MHGILIAANAATTKPCRRDENRLRYADTAMITAKLPYLQRFERGSGWLANHRRKRSQPSVVDLWCGLGILRVGPCLELPILFRPGDLAIGGRRLADLFQEI